MDLAEHSADQANDRLAVREDADHVSAPTDLAVEPLLGVVAPDLPPVLLGEGREGEQILRGLVEMSAAFGRPRRCSTVRAYLSSVRIVRHTIEV